MVASIGGAGHPSGMAKVGIEAATATVAPGETQKNSRGLHVEEEVQSTTAGNEKASWVRVTEENLHKMKNVAILQHEGIVYCPVPKVSAQPSNALCFSER